MSSRLVLPLALDPSALGSRLHLPAAPAGVARSDVSFCNDPAPLGGNWSPELHVSWTNPGGLSAVKLEYFRAGVSEGITTLAGAAAASSHVFAATDNSVATVDTSADVWFVNAAGEGPKTHTTLALNDPC
jgi:hypothetical protein